MVIVNRPDNCSVRPPSLALSPVSFAPQQRTPLFQTNPQAARVAARLFHHDYAQPTNPTVYSPTVLGGSPLPPLFEPSQPFPVYQGSSPYAGTVPQQPATPVIEATTRGGARLPGTSEVRFASPLVNTYSPSTTVTTAHTSTPESISAKRITPPKDIGAPKTTAFSAKEKGGNQGSNEKVVHRPAQRPKTIAFGKTVNVSQTVEASSKSAKAMASRRSAPGIVKQTIHEGEEKENIPPGERGKDDGKSGEKAETQTNSGGGYAEELSSLRDEVQHLRILDEERQGEVERLRRDVQIMKEKDGERADQILKLSTALNEFVRDRRKSSPIGESRRYRESRERSRSPPPPPRIPPCLDMVPSPMRPNMQRRETRDRRTERDQTVRGRQKPDVIRSNVSVLERRMMEDPIFRQLVLDAIEEDDLRNGKERVEDRENRERRDNIEERGRTDRQRERSPQGRVFGGRSPPKNNRGPTFTEKVTVERQFRVPPHLSNQFSMDTQQFLNDNHLVSDVMNKDEFVDVVSSIYHTRPVESSMYQPGESVYLNDRRGKTRYTVQSPTSEVEDCYDDEMPLGMDKTRGERGGMDDSATRKEHLARIRDRAKQKTKEKSRQRDDDF